MRKLVPAVLAAAILSIPLGMVASEAAGRGDHGMLMDFQGLNLTSQQQQAMGQIMDQSRQQMEQLQSQGRLRILGALTPAHRALLAQIVGSLATAPNPDESAAIHQLDASLSPGEAQNIVSLHESLMQQMHGLMESSHNAMLNVLTDQQKSQLESSNSGGNRMWYGPGGPPPGPPGAQIQGGGPMRQPLTAGAILLHLSTHDMGPVFFMRTIHS
ncbi:MAG TPA: Spy/CpxP family protein refolding chaperone [Candidatus Eremiobacteraceae bacterium]|nr:Spy/CpxP family protein refolding chaperone [Candidatus Eremiobacteraceae bacterium]